MEQTQAIAQAFLDGFYGGCIHEDSRFAIWTKHDRRHLWCSSVEYGVKKFNEKIDTYFSMCVFPRGITKRRSENAAGLFGVWLDVDCGDKGTGQNYFPSVDKAIEWVEDTLAGRWSKIVHSGGGLHVYLMFDETFWIEGDEDRLRARKLIKAFHQWADEQCPYTIDALIDLARVMRLPGSYHTEAKALCHVIDECDTVASFSELEELLPKVEVDEKSQMAGTDGDVKYEDVKNKIQMLRESDSLFDKTWRRARRFKDNSPSGYCMSIANTLCMSGFKDGEVVAALKIWRQGQTDASEKPDQWYQITVGKARAVNSVDVVGNQLTSAIEEADDDLKLNKISAVFGKEVVSITKRITPEYKGKKERCTYRINFKDHKLDVPSTDVLLSQNLMRVLAFENINVMMAPLKPNKWADFMTLILQVIEESEEAIEGNLAYNIEGELQRFIGKKREAINVATNISEWKATMILEEDDAVYFPWSAFKMHLSSASYGINNKELASILRGLGCSSKQFNDKARTRLWCAPRGE